MVVFAASLRGRNRGLASLLTGVFLCLAAVIAWGGQTDDGLDEIAEIFGAQGQAVRAIAKLGGKVEFGRNGRSKRVVAVDLSGSSVADSDMAAVIKLLKDLPELASLDLSDTGLTDEGLGRLQGLTGLSRLNVAGTKATDSGLARLRKNLRAYISLLPRGATYFPDSAIRPGPDDFLARWYAEDLFAMREPSLWTLAREDPKAVAFRFTWFPSFRSPLSIRVVPSGEGATLHAVRLDAGSGYAGGKPTDRRDVKLSRERWAALKRRVDDADFWSLPSEMWTSGIADGAGYLFEGVDGGKYHVVNANTNPKPDDRYRRYKSLCEEMVKLAGIDIQRF